MRIALIAVAVFGFVAPSQALAAPSADTAIAKSFAVHAKGGFGGHVTRIGASASAATRRSNPLNASLVVRRRKSSWMTICVSSTGGGYGSASAS